MFKRVLIQLMFFMGMSVCYADASAVKDASDLADLSFESISGMVTSVSKRSEPQFKTAAAIHVINEDDIRHSGATSIAELLRMVPGVHVARIDAVRWSITSRGFNGDGFGNKLLVLMDGRTLYSPLFSGMYWDTTDTILEDIERIEVIRGPGASIWGANAVNGVINIITKNSKHTQTNVVSASLGTESKFIFEGRHGRKVKSKELFYRSYAKRVQYDHSTTPMGTTGHDSWVNNRAGYRMDWDVTKQDQIMVSADVFRGEADFLWGVPDGSMLYGNTKITGGHVLGKWERVNHDQSKSTLQAYFDRYSRSHLVFDQDTNTADIDYQFNTNIGTRHQLVLGGNYRLVWDETEGSTLLSLADESRTTHLFSAFIQDAFAIVPDKLHVILGSKLEHNAYTGFEIQPTARLLWTPSHHHTAWAAFSRAVRIPSRVEDDTSLVNGIVPGPPPNLVRVLGSSGIKSEVLYAYELGYRANPHPKVTFDATAFFNDYDELRTYTPTTQTLPADTAVGLDVTNSGEAKSYGFELASTVDVLKSWKVKGSYSLLQIDVEDNSAFMGAGVILNKEAGTSPKNMATLISQIYLPYSVELSQSLYYVDNLDSIATPAYLRFDTRIGWEPLPGLEFSLVGQNLFDDAQKETATSVSGANNEIERNFYGNMKIRF